MRPPVVIAAFAICFLGAATLDLVDGLLDLSNAQRRYELLYPHIGWTRDWTIVALSAIFTIACIPVALIVIGRSRIARYLALAASGYAAIAFTQWAIPAWMESKSVSPIFGMRGLLMASAFAFLAAPSASRWFAQDRTAQTNNA